MVFAVLPGNWRSVGLTVAGRTVHKHIGNLEQKGLLKRDANRSRSIDLLKPKGKAKQFFFPPAMAAAEGWTLPFAGRIVAGQPLEAFENSSEKIRYRTPPCSKEVFALGGEWRKHAGRAHRQW